MDVSIIIINYKTSNLVLQCLRSIKKYSSGFSFETIIVDNSYDEIEFAKLLDVARQFDFARVINADGNLGTSKANNLGAKASRGEYLMFLNSDTILMNNAIYEMWKCATRNSRIGGVGANLFDIKEKPTHSFAFLEITPDVIKKRSKVLSCLFPNLLEPSPDFNYGKEEMSINGYICLAAELISRDCFENVGGFDEDIFMYAEDALFGHELLNKGYLQVNTPEARIIHLEGGSDEKAFSSFKINNIVNGNFVYWCKAFGKDEAVKCLKNTSKFMKIRYFKNMLAGKQQQAHNYKNLSVAYAAKAKRCLLDDLQNDGGN